MTPATTYRRGSEAIMAEIPMSGQTVPPSVADTGTSVVNWAGAAISLALVVGTCVWGYKLLVRDVSGVPVVRAVEGPMRIQPENPGGRQADHQGLSVNDVAAIGTAGKPADRFVLAPAPISLNEEDTNVVMARAPTAPTASSTGVSTPARAASPAQAIVAPEPLQNEEMMSIEALAAQIAGDTTPLSTSGPADTAPVKVALGPVDEMPEAEAIAEAPAKPKIKGGIKTSLRPQLRPATLGQAVKVASASPAAAALPTVVQAGDIPAGTRMVQLGAFASAEIAVVEWDKLNARFGDYLGDKTRVIQKATSGGRVFFRLRAMGFNDVNDARRLCSALKAEKADCIPVTTR